MAVTATFNAGTLTEFGDTLDNAIITSRDAAGSILVNGDAVAVQGGTPTVANTSLIQVFGQSGNDTLTIDEANGALPSANLVGGAGDDTLTGGSSADTLSGESDNDTLLGKGGNDLLFGGDGNDVLLGGDGDDQVFGQTGNDRMVWNPGDDSDLFEGGDGTDTAEVNGDNSAEAFTATANGTRVRFDRIDPVPFSLDIGTTENLVLNMNGGDDRFSASGNLAALITLTIDGGAGNDTILGGNGADTLLGGDGNDFIDGNQGNDIAFLGAGDDVSQWDPGDGNDTVEGQADFDTLVFNGANINERIDISANGGRVRFFRDVASITMDLDEIERIDFHALGGADNIVINDLSGTDLPVGGVLVDLAGTLGGVTGDGALDTVTANGTAGNDAMRLLSFNGGQFNGGIGIVGTPAGIVVVHQEATDQLIVNGGAGNDLIDASGMVAGSMALTLNGGDGNDAFFGSQGNDLIFGGNGDDAVIGGRGNDTAFLGAGDDAFGWDPGDGSDTIEGEVGFDRLVFAGSAENENITISANGARTTLFRDVGTITMDLNDVERIDVDALSGADNIVINDLTGTALPSGGVLVDLAGTRGGSVSDGALDTVTATGTGGDDAIRLFSFNGGQFNGGIGVTGTPAGIVVIHQDATDQLIVNGGLGNDTIDASAVLAGSIVLILNGGPGNDRIIGSQGDDTVRGGTGDDLAFLGAGNDTVIWNPGDGNDTVEGQAGFDTLVFNGANINERIDISANGGRVRFSRDVANITMDLDEIERIDFHALGGTDNIVINDLSGTDLPAGGALVDLAGTLGGAGGDGAVDTVTANGTAGNDAMRLFSINGGPLNGGIGIVGTPAGVVVLHQEGTDQLIVNGGAGNDLIDASAVVAGSVSLTLNGGIGNDTIIGSQGDDLVIGGFGNDVALLGAGNDTFVWNPGDGSDTVEGQGGFDTLVFNGANINENIDISANGGRVRFSRDVATITMDLNGVEGIQLNALGGADTITVNDLTGTNVSQVAIDLGLPSGSGLGDGQADTIIINATNGADAITVATDNGVVRVPGLAAILTISGFEANDRIVVNGLGGDDAVDASGLTGMLFTANGGDGDDVLIGSAGNDTLTGGAGDDVLIGGAGQDILDGGPGDNVVIQSATVATLNDGGGAGIAFDSPQSASLALLAQSMATSFVAAGDSSGTPIADPSSSQQLLLTQPHA
jgi:Ca2+-binding RTX toxin-like protein